MKRKLLSELSKPWSKQTKAEKRVTIAKDAIASIKAGLIKAVTGQYWKNIMDFTPQNENDGSVNLQEVLCETKKSCHVCEKGALFIASVVRDNKVQMNWIGFDEKTHNRLENNSGQVNHLKKWFDELQLDMMENAFEEEFVNEGFDGTYKGRRTLRRYVLGKKEKLFLKSKKFGDKYNVSGKHNVEKRMIAILENVIKNKGTFKP